MFFLVGFSFLMGFNIPFYPDMTHFSTRKYVENKNLRLIHLLKLAASKINPNTVQRL